MAKSRNRDARIDRLLAGKPGLAVSEKEEMLERLLEESAESAPRRGAIFLRFLAAGAVAASVLVAVLFLRPPADEFGVRGGKADAKLALSCHTSGTPCRTGDKIFFRVVSPENEPHLSVFARRQDGHVIWYFPQTEAGVSATVSSPGRSVMLDFSIQLGPEHEPGTYQVTGLFSKRPLTREEVRNQIRRAEATTLVESTLEVVSE